MNQQKIGGFLKGLRKEKGLTQEQLADLFNISSRTVSRWETGRNLPDVGMLMELADFYGVDIREVIDGERQSAHSEREVRETLRKVAGYAEEKEDRAQSRVVVVALGISVTVLACTWLFAGEMKGLLYGIVPESICNNIMLLVYGTAFALLTAWLKAHWWQEKPSREPIRTVTAAVVSKEVKSGTGGAGRSKGGCSYVINFQTEDGEILELYAYEVEFGGLREGEQGNLTYKGRYFIDFKKTGRED